MKTADTLHTQRTPLQVIEVAEQAANLADQSIQTAISQSPPAPHLACREGCAWCCHKLVGTTAPEVFRIGDYLEQQLLPEELEIVRERIIRRNEERKAMREDRWSAARLALQSARERSNFRLSRPAADVPRFQLQRRLPVRTMGEGA